jgi:alpha-1,3-mannosyltransferase
VKPNQVTHVVRQFHPAIGGFEDVVLSLAKVQREKWGIDARVVTLDRIFTNQAHVLPHQDNVQGIPVTRIPWRGSTRYPLAPSVITKLADSDIVHVHAIDFLFDYLALARPLHGHHLVASTHGGFFHTNHAHRLKRLWFGTVTRAAVKAYDAIIAVSEADATMFAPIAGSRLVTIENGVNLDKFPPRQDITPDPRRIITFGRLTRHKRLDRMIALLAALRQKEPGWTLVIAGPKGDHPCRELMQTAIDAGVADAVQVRVGLTHDELAKEVAGAGWFGSASAYEGFGLAAVEASAAGLLTVLSGIGPFVRLNRKLGMGILFNPECPEEVIPEMMAMADRLKDGQHAVSKQLKAAVSDYGWGPAAEAHEKLYQLIIGRKAHTYEALR